MDVLQEFEAAIEIEIAKNLEKICTVAVKCCKVCV